jgi:hypothetical protein
MVIYPHLKLKGLKVQHELKPYVVIMGFITNWFHFIIIQFLGENHLHLKKNLFLL